MSENAAFDTLSPAEAAYFSSGGKDASGLLAETPAQAPTEPAGGLSQSLGTDGAPDKGAAPDAENPALDGEDDGEEVVITGKDGKPRAQNGRFVPHQALHKERERHKMTRSELEQTRMQQARADERLAVLNEILRQADTPAAAQPGARQPQQQQPIDAEADPIGALSQALSKIQALEAQINESRTQTQERENARAMQSAYQNDAVRYMTDKPEFKDAYQYLIRQRHAELNAMGVSDEAERNRFIAKEESQIVAQAFQNKRSPAQMLHQLAIARGFQHSAQPAPVKDDPVRKIEQIANGQRKAGASLSAAGGSSGEGLTTAALADMSEEEFASVVQKLGKAGMRRLLGG